MRPNQCGHRENLNFLEGTCMIFLFTPLLYPKTNEFVYILFNNQKNIT